MSSRAKETLYILDGSAYVFRAFYANPTLTTSTGYPTSALMGFAGMMRKILRNDRPDYLAVTFDAGAVTFRNEMYAEYKANRSTPPSELITQMPRIRDLVRAMNIAVFEQAGLEADDLIASMVRRFENTKDLQIVICSADKDLMQLLGSNVTMLDSMRDKRFAVEDVKTRFQVGPDKVAHVLALAGDTSDNIPGVPGIGEKTAGKLIAEFGSVEEVLANIDNISGKKRKENLTNFADQARLSLDLVKLKEDVPMDVELSSLKLQDPNYDALEALYKEFEFSRFLRDLEKEKFKGESTTPLVSHEKRYSTILSEADLDAAVEAITKTGLFSFDLETTSIDPLKAEIVGMSMAWEDHQGVYVPVGHRYLGVPKQLSLELVMSKVGPLLESETIRTVAHHAKYEWIILQRYGVNMRGMASDTLLASYLVDPSRLNHGLDALALDVLSQSTTKYTDVAGKGRKQITFDMVDLERAAPYAAEDADVTLLLHKAFWPKLVEAGLDKLHDDMELPLTWVLAKMERQGIKIDADALRTLSETFATEIHALEKQAHAEAGQTFNLNSPIQLRKILFEELGLKSNKRTKSGLSTDQSVLEKLAKQHPLPALILEYRSFAKLKSTYVDAIPDLMHDDGRIHTDFNQAVAATGRLSSSNPNLQNIPIRTTRGREIRKAFIADEGYTLLSADYSQIELRLLAHLSGDPTLVAAFKDGEDIHRRTAAEVLNIPQVLVSKEQRRVGKTLNFGIVYGMGSNRLARDLNIKRDQASDYIEAYFNRYGAVKAYFDGLINKATNQGYTETMFGRRRSLPELASMRENVKALGERLAVNTPIQGAAADLIKIAMIRIQDRIEQEDLQARMLLQVHDELVFEVKDEVLADFTAMIKTEMVGVAKLKVPLIVDTGNGKTWFDIK